MSQITDTLENVGPGCLRVGPPRGVWVCASHLPRVFLRHSPSRSRPGLWVPSSLGPLQGELVELGGEKPRRSHGSLYRRKDHGQTATLMCYTNAHVHFAIKKKLSAGPKTLASFNIYTTQEPVPLAPSPGAISGLQGPLSKCRPSKVRLQPCPLRGGCRNLRCHQPVTVLTGTVG